MKTTDALAALGMRSLVDVPGIKGVRIDMSGPVPSISIDASADIAMLAEAAASLLKAAGRFDADMQRCFGTIATKILNEAGTPK